MFGKGVYFADMISKSANYCFADGKHDSFMLLCEVALGKQQEEKEAKEKCKLKRGYHSVKGECRVFQLCSKYLPLARRWWYGSGQQRSDHHG